MSRRRILLGAALASPLLAVGVLWAAGASLPRTHVVALSARLKASPTEVWHAVTDFEDAPSWRPDLASVTLGQTEDGHPTYVEVDNRGRRVAYEVVEARFPDDLVVAITTANLGYGGSWSFSIHPDGDGTDLVITERGFVRSALGRAMDRYLGGRGASLRRYLGALGTKIGEPITPREVSPP